MTRLLILLCAVLAALAALPWLPAADEAEALSPPPAPRTASSAAMAPLPELGPLETYTETLARPLFTASRRPPPETGKTTDTSGLLLDRYRLRGVIITAERRSVVLAPVDGGKAIRLSEGEDLDGWNVERISPDILVLREGEVRRELPLAPVVSD